MTLYKNQPPSIIKLKDFELLEIYQYITNNIELFNKTDDLNMIKTWHLIELINKIETAYHKIARTNKVARLKINEIEKHILSIMFKIKPCDNYMIVLESLFIKNLVKFNTNGKFTPSHN